MNQLKQNGLCILLHSSIVMSVIFALFSCDGNTEPKTKINKYKKDSLTEKIDSIKRITDDVMNEYNWWLDSIRQEDSILWYNTFFELNTIRRNYKIGHSYIRRLNDENGVLVTYHEIDKHYHYNTTCTEIDAGLLNTYRIVTEKWARENKYCPCQCTRDELEDEELEYAPEFRGNL